MANTASFPSGYYHALLDTNTGAFELVAFQPLEAHLLDDASDFVPADGSAGDGIETSGESLAINLPTVPMNTVLTYTGWSHNGDMFAQDSGGAWYLFSNDTSLPAGTTGTAVALEYRYPCFVPGTLIATPSGERTVESLAIGDLVTTRSGGAVPVRWIGRRRVPLTPFNRAQALPIRVAAGALGGEVPRRDLWLSADHALWVDGVLVHAGALVNGRTITQAVEWGDEVEYLHVETEAHEVIFAEGAPAETFIDNDARRRFDNCAEYEALYPDAAPMEELDLPRVKFARQLPMVIRRRLDSVADARLGAMTLAA